MKQKSWRFSLLTAFLAALLWGLGLVGLAPDKVLVPVCAQQSGCPQMNIGGNTSLTWPPGATVKVFFDSSVSPDRRAIYEEVLNNWSRGNNQGVTFVFEAETGQSQYSMSITDAIPNGDNSQRGMVAYQGWDANGALQFVDIQMNPNVTDSSALRNAMSHEVAHNFGLNHTADGRLSNRTASSLYNTANGLNDTTTGAPGPTPCDNQAVNSIYASGGVRYTRPVNEGGGGDGGGGGGDVGGGGGCTEYWWVQYECDTEEARVSRQGFILKATYRPAGPRRNLTTSAAMECREVDRWYAGCW